jgi:hypothetical protein
MSRRLGCGQFLLEWDGDHLQALHWQKRTVEREREADQLATSMRAPGEDLRTARAAALEAVCGTSFADALSEAASFFDVSYSTLHRLVRPPLPKRSRALTHMRGTTFYKIRKARHPDNEEFRKALDKAVLGPSVTRLLREYLAYVERELERYGVHRTGKHNIAPAKSRHADASRPRKEWQAREAFWLRAKRLGAPATRAMLADRRTYDPIVGWNRLRNTLPNRDQTRIVRAGYRREERLLRAELRTLRAAMRGETK